MNAQWFTVKWRNGRFAVSNFVFGFLRNLAAARSRYRRLPPEAQEAAVKLRTKSQVSHREDTQDASTEGVIGKSATACLSASIRMRQTATLGEMTNLGLKGIFTAASRKDGLPLLCR